MHVTLARWGAAGVLVVAGVTACGSTDDSASAKDGGSASTSKASKHSLPEDVCKVLTPKGVSDAVGAPVTLKMGPSGDCEFSQDDPRAVSGSLGVVGDARQNGGYEGYLAGVAGTLKSVKKRSVSGIGDAASTFTGLLAMGGSQNLMAGGVVDRGDFLLQTTLVQAQSMAANDLDQVSERLLRLLDGSIS